jgi:hypothetical protein
MLDSYQPIAYEAVGKLEVSTDFGWRSFRAKVSKKRQMIQQTKNATALEEVRHAREIKLAHPGHRI